MAIAKSNFMNEVKYGGMEKVGWKFWAFYHCKMTGAK